MIWLVQIILGLILIGVFLGFLSKTNINLSTMFIDGLGFIVDFTSDITTAFIDLIKDIIF